MDGTWFYFLGGGLTLAALIIAAIGIRGHEKFPPNRGVMAAGIGIFFLLVVGSAATAVVNAREEQDDRRREQAEELAQAAEEAGQDQGGTQGSGENESAPLPPGGAQAEVDQGVPPGRGAQTDLDVTSPESGDLVFEPAGLEARAGSITITYDNPSQVPHSIAIETQGQAIEESDTVTDDTTEVSAELAPGQFTYFCTVPGHREAGMEGTLTVVGPGG